MYWVHSTHRPRNSPRIAIIGAGFAGLGMAIRLKRAGFDLFAIFEQASDIGGTWRDNAYPGLRPNTPAHLYSYSFEMRRSRTRRYAEPTEILGYLRGLVRKYGLRRHLRLGTAVSEARYESGRWRVRTASGEEHQFDVLVSGVGQLNRPRMPGLPGAASFSGMSFHTSRWNRDHDLRGRRVAVVGTGASAAQLVPTVAAVAQRLYVFQRTPNWVVPKPGAALTTPARLALRYVPGLQRCYRWWQYLSAEATLGAAQRRQRPARRLERKARRHLTRQVSDPELRRELTPGYPIGRRRVIIDNDFYPALARPNVSLVTEKIARVTEHGVETVDGVEHQVDTIIYATGFHSGDILARVDIYGRGGRRLRDQWQSRAEAYLGVATPHFPNLFFLYGPNTHLSHNSVIFMIECQLRYILSCLRRLSTGARPGELEVRPRAMAAYQRRLERAMSRTRWEADRVTNWPMPATSYRWLMRLPHTRVFRLTKRR